MSKSFALLSLLWGFCCYSIVAQAQSIPPIPRRIPPTDGIEVPAEKKLQLKKALATVQKRLTAVAKHPLAADAEIYAKAVDYALQHNEFYNARQIPSAADALKRAGQRIDLLSQGKSPWVRQRGLVVRGYRSSIDGSPQPYGLEIPDDVDFNKPVPLYVWLHGRGDKTTDLHFITQRQSRAGRIAPPGAIVLHPFGRHCVGYKSAGEIDVLEAVQHVKAQYKIDADRIVLMGFSMGGAGCWHVGAHYADRWVAMSPGAGFAETARYNNIKPADYPPSYEQKLWGLYDVPHYTRNLFNLPVIVYSGEKDKQIQAARVMEEAYLAHGRKLPHLIGPGMGHRYHPETLKQLMKMMQAEAAKGLNRTPKKVSLQTRTLRYSRVHWVEVLRLQQHWRDSRVDAEIVGPNKINVKTKNVAMLRLDPWKNQKDAEVTIDGQKLTIPIAKQPGDFIHVLQQAAGGKWNSVRILPMILYGNPESTVPLSKKPGLQGPIDDALMDPFLVVLPSGKSKHEQVQRWVEFQQKHFLDRWRALMRGEARIKLDTQVTEDDIKKYHLILWGDPTSNELLNKAMQAPGKHRLPIAWTDKTLAIGSKIFSAAGHVPILIYPNPLNRDKYIVINSGMTHREGDDRTNSLQNPKLPDWAVIDLSQAPDNLSPGKVVAADFFDEAWQVKTK